MAAIDDDLGKRERGKRETRASLLRAADALFAERGYDRTTVRDIAEAAGVTERTFFRYFAAKEELVLDEAMTGIPRFVGLIRARPVAERAVEAIGAAVVELERELRSSARPTVLSLFADNRPAELMRRMGGRAFPGRILAIEDALVAPVRERLRMDGHADGPDLDFRAQTLARTTVALVRSALVRDLELRRSGFADAPSLGALGAAAFADLAAVWASPAEPH
ncbi:MAG: TetR/AcrR family transcriptional regulator [Demequina sp.]|nr:TetR/AcrR family transcriptional regulator [Demequina sp.]